MPLSQVSMLGFALTTQCSAWLLTTNSTVLDKDKEEVTEYFNNNGFERWNKIYSDSDEVNGVQMDIRTGHAQTIDKVKTSHPSQSSQPE